jgi:hypothetical protein
LHEAIKQKTPGWLNTSAWWNMTSHYGQDSSLVANVEAGSSVVYTM